LRITAQLAFLLPLGFFTLNALCQPCSLPPGIVGWWAAEDNADDETGVNPGSLQSGATFAAGEVGDAFSLDGVAAYISVPQSVSLDVGTGDGFTIECWISPADLSDGHALVEWNDASGHIGVQFWISVPGYGGVGSIFGNIVDDSGTDHIFASSSGTLMLNTFQHVALSYNRTNGVAKIYYNGAVVTSQNFGIFIPQTSYGLYFGTRISGGNPGGYYAGLLDELTIYSRALSDTEVASIANAGIAGKCRMAAPVIITEPADRAVAVGGKAYFAIAVNGVGLSYQWQLNGSDIAGATNWALVLDNIQTNQSGAYSVTITNLYGPTNSASAQLTVDATCISAAPGLVSWWPAEGDAVDRYSGNNAVLQGSAGFTSGESGQGFTFDGTNSYISIAASPLLDVGASNGLTIECWIKPADVSAGHALVEWNNGAGPVGTHFWTSVPGYGGVGSLFANFMDIRGGSHVLSSSNVLITNIFQHVAVTYNRTNGIARLYRNGAVVASGNVGTNQPQTSYPLYMGTRVSGTGGTAFYNGVMDEVAIYSRALSDSEINVIFNAGSAAKTCTPPEIVTQPQNIRVKPGTNVTFSAAVRGGFPLTYQWRLNNSTIAGATNSSLTISNAQPSDAGNYSLVLTNPLGSVVSSNGVLRVDVVFPLGNGQLLTNPQYVFGGSVTIQLTNVYKNGDIFYTLDGSAPSFMSYYYNGPFILTQSATLRALGYSPDFFQSAESDPVSIVIVPAYTLTATTPGGGSVTLSPPGGIYVSNSLVTVTATAANGWTFLQWLGDLSGTHASSSVTVNHNKSVQAVFGTTLATTASGGGSVVLNPSSPIYPYGASVQVSGVPDAGNYFGLWGNAAGGNANPLQFQVTNANPTVSALFAAMSGGNVALTIVPVGDGHISANPLGNVYQPGESVLIAATPIAGQSFLGWSGAASGLQNPLTVLMDQSKTINAMFSRRPRISTTNSFEGFKPEGFTFTMAGDIGARYVLDASFNLQDWGVLHVFTNVAGSFQFTDSAATNLPRRFYRSILLP
jgi:hypothetical protein